MSEKWLIIGSDARLKSLAKKLSDGERTVYYKNVSVWDEELNKTANSFKPNHLVLPIHPLPIEVPVVLGINQATIYSGKLNDEWRSILNNHDIHFYLEDEAFIWKNAVLTAEAFVASFYNTKNAIQGKKFIISGFGRVSKMVAHILHSIGADICIAVRSNVQLNEAKAFRYDAVYIQEVWEIEADYFINTIPARWLNETLNKQLPMPIYDLASNPGCLQDGVVRDDYQLLLALPGKFFPEDAAHVLYESIVGELRRREACFKEKELG